jgi:hypothetical protein
MTRESVSERVSFDAVLIVGDVCNANCQFACALNAIHSSQTNSLLYVQSTVQTPISLTT